MAKKALPKLEIAIRPVEPGKTKRWRWEIWTASKCIQRGEYAGGQSGARAEAEEALEGIKEHFRKTGKLKAYTPFQPGNFL